MFIIPPEFNQNATKVREMGPPAQTGKMLLDHMAKRLGLNSLENLDILDFGCGSRFADAIVNLRVPLKSYVGVDTQRAMIEFLARHVPDERLSFFHFESFNHLYNRDGAVLTENSRLPIGDFQFDLICMFSVITHQGPGDTRNILKMLRRYVRPEGKLFFTADVQPALEYYAEELDAPCGLSAYSLELLAKLIRLGGWRVMSLEPRGASGLPMMESFLCSPI